MDYIFISRWEKDFRIIIRGERKAMIGNDFDKVYWFHCFYDQEKLMTVFISHLPNSKGPLY